MRVRQIVPHGGDEHDLATDEGRAWLDTRYAPDPEVRVRLNMITSLTGAAAGGDGTSETLTSATDRRILGIIRAHADVVVVGAATVRAEGYLLPRRARLAVVTTTGDLSGHKLADAAESVLLVCPASRADAVRERAALGRAEVVAVDGDDDLDPHAIRAALTAHGLPRMVCEGGPRLAAHFAAAGAIDEYCISVAPVLEPASRGFLPVRERVNTDVAGMLVDEAGFSYLRLRPLRSGPAPAATA